MYTLYSIPGSCSTGIHVLMRKLGVAVDIVMRSEVNDYVQLVPTNQVPALQQGDLLLTEGAAIALHLLEQHGELPDNPQQLMQLRQWLMFNYATLHPAYGKLFTVSGAMDDSPEKQALLETLAARVSELWGIVERHLAEQHLSEQHLSEQRLVGQGSAGHAYMLGEQPSLIDYLLAVYSRWGNNFPSLSIALGEHTQRHIERVMQLPEFIAAAEAEGIELATAA